VFESRRRRGSSWADTANDLTNHEERAIRWHGVLLSASEELLAAHSANLLSIDSIA
jgi:hypothetical protein